MMKAALLLSFVAALHAFQQPLSFGRPSLALRVKNYDDFVGQVFQEFAKLKPTADDDDDKGDMSPAMMQLPLLLMLVSSVHAFHFSAAYRRPKSANDQRFAKCLEDFLTLEKDLALVQGQNDEEAAAELAETMLEKAIEIAVAHRLVELEHKFEAKKKLKKVLEEQKVAKGRLEIALENTEAAEERVNTSENCETEPADPECVRDAAIAQTAQYVATDSAALLKKADVAVNKATRDLEEAETAIEQLEQREKDLQKTLADFIAVKQKKAAAA